MSTSSLWATPRKRTVAVAERRRIQGEYWFAWYSDQHAQWVLKYRVKVGLWKMHRVPKTVQEDDVARRYCKTFVKARADAARASRVPGRPSNGTIWPGMTFKELGELWTSGKLAQLYPRYVRSKKSASDDAARLRIYVYDHIGQVPIEEFVAPKGLELAESVMAALPPRAELSDATARQVGQVIRYVLRLAVHPLHLLVLPSPGFRRNLNSPGATQSRSGCPPERS